MGLTSHSLPPPPCSRLRPLAAICCCLLPSAATCCHSLPSDAPFGFIGSAFHNAPRYQAGSIWSASVKWHDKHLCEPRPSAQPSMWDIDDWRCPSGPRLRARSGQYSWDIDSDQCSIERESPANAVRPRHHAADWAGGIYSCTVPSSGAAACQGVCAGGRAHVSLC